MKTFCYKTVLSAFLLLTTLFVGCSDDDGKVEPQALYWEKVYPGWQQTIAMRSDGTLWGWGNNLWGQLGNGTDGAEASSTIPTQISSETNWDKIAQGSIHTLAIRSNGTLWSWGFNMYGQLGINSTSDKNHPVQVGTSNNWVAVAASINHSMGLKSDGSLWTWGDNVHGEIGDGTYDIKLIPTKIGGNDWTAIKAGTIFSVAMKNDGSVWAWGSILGEWHNTPIQIAPSGSWSEISGGEACVMAIKSNGTLWSIGEGNQMGLGNFGPYETFTQVGTDSHWKKVCTGNTNTIALKTDGTLWTWGGNLYGELGNGTTNVHTNTPAQIEPGSQWEYIPEENSSRFTFARKTDKTLWGFGWNHAGQLGIGTNSDSNVPVLVPCPQQ